MRAICGALASVSLVLCSACERGYRGPAASAIVDGVTQGPLSPSIGDLDGDGRDDWVIDVDDPGIGLAFVSVLDGRVLGRIDRAITAGAEWVHVVPVGDLDGDGKHDALFERLHFLHERDHYVVQAVSSHDGHVLFELEGRESRRGSVADLGDIDGDGLTDLAFGCEPEKVRLDRGGYRGSVLFVSGASGVAIAQLDGAREDDRFGGSVVALNDIDGDGVRDLAIGALGAEPRIEIVSGRTRSSLTKLALNGDATPQLGWPIGGEVSGCGDIDGDGHDELAVHLGREWLLVSPMRGVVRPVPLLDVVSIAHFGDWNSDGQADLCIQRLGSGEVRSGEPVRWYFELVNGQTFELLLTVWSTSTEPCGGACGDVDGDGETDLGVQTSEGLIGVWCSRNAR